MTGPESQLDDLDALKTTPVSLDGHAFPFEESVAVVIPQQVAVRDVQPARVTVRVPLRPPSPAGGDRAATPRKP